MNDFFKKKPLYLAIAIGFAIFCCYVLLISSDRYVSHSQFIIKGQDIQAADWLGAISGLPSSDTHQEGEILVARLNAHEVLEAIDNKFKLTQLFGCRLADWLSCLSISASKEQQLKYWQKRTNVHLDSSNGIISLDTQAFSAQHALELNQELLRLSEAYINAYNQRIMQDALSISQQELTRLETELRQKEQALSAYQGQENSADPMAASQTKLNIIGQLEGQLAQAKTELSTMRSYMRATAPAVIAQQQKLNAIQRQLNAENERLLEDNMGTDSLPKSDYEKLLLDKELAQKAYAAALAAHESTKFETKKQQRYLIRISNPSLPDEATEPKRLMLIAKVLAALLLILGIGQLILLTIKDHIGWT